MSPPVTVLAAGPWPRPRVCPPEEDLIRLLKPMVPELGVVVGLGCWDGWEVLLNLVRRASVSFGGWDLMVADLELRLGPCCWITTTGTYWDSFC